MKTLTRHIRNKSPAFIAFPIELMRMTSYDGDCLDNGSIKAQQIINLDSFGQREHADGHGQKTLSQLLRQNDSEENFLSTISGLSKEGHNEVIVHRQKVGNGWINAWIKGYMWVGVLVSDAHYL